MPRAVSTPSKARRSEINYVYEHGQVVAARSAYICELRFKDIPVEDRNISWINRLVGVELVLSPQDAGVLTLYKKYKKASRWSGKTTGSYCQA